jgi:hypothetical protein
MTIAVSSARVDSQVQHTVRRDRDSETSAGLKGSAPRTPITRMKVFALPGVGGRRSRLPTTRLLTVARKRQTFAAEDAS